jgi:predicted nucleotidyltransferase
MNQIIYDISKNIKRVFNKVDINLYIVGSYANNTQREDSDINVHLFSEDYDLDKQTKLIQLFRMSLDQKINKKLKISTYDIKSLTTDKPSLSQIEHYCRLYNGSYVAHNDFGLDPSKIRTPDQNLTDLCNQINLAAQWFKD